MQVSQAPSTLAIGLDQMPCDFQISYSAHLRSNAGQFTESLPSFIQLNGGGQTSSSFTLGPTTHEDIGLYEIKLEALLANRASTSGSITFTVEVLCSPASFAFSSMSDQTVTIGDAPRQFDLSLSQFPCNYNIEYSYFSAGEFGS